MPAELSPAAADVLVALARYPHGVAAADLRDRWGDWPNPAKRGGLLGQLVRRGLAVREGDLYRLTDAGWAEAGRHDG